MSSRLIYLSLEKFVITLKVVERIFTFPGGVHVERSTDHDRAE